MNPTCSAAWKILAGNQLLKSKESLLVFREELSFCLAKEGRLHFIAEPDRGYRPESNDVLVNKIKILIKRWPKLFAVIYNFIGVTFVGLKPEQALSELGDNKLIINLGSGVRRRRKDIINVDFYPFENVDIVADANQLPFADNSIDAIINESLLEHTPNPERIVQEMLRVLKPGGLLYLSTPFVASFHSSPEDYYRWSKQGLKQLLKDFEELDCGVRCGPSSALNYVLSEWLSIILSFNSALIHQILFMFFLVVFSPLCLLDYLIYKWPASENIAYAFYYFAKKK